MLSYELLLFSNLASCAVVWIHLYDWGAVGQFRLDCVLFMWAVSECLSYPPHMKQLVWYFLIWCAVTHVERSCWLSLLSCARLVFNCVKFYDRRRDLLNLLPFNVHRYYVFWVQYFKAYFLHLWRQTSGAWKPSCPSSDCETGLYKVLRIRFLMKT